MDNTEKKALEAALKEFFDIEKIKLEVLKEAAQDYVYNHDMTIDDSIREALETRLEDVFNEILDEVIEDILRD